MRFVVFWEVGLNNYVSKFAYICIVESRFEKYKGIHPGVVLARELKKRSIRQRPFALDIGEHPQTFNAIINGRRDLNTALALKIEKALSIEEGTLMILQVFHYIKKEKEKIQNDKPDLSLFRKSLFWDTDINKIDWLRQYRAVVQRVLERGNKQEIDELERFYGRAKMRAAQSLPKTRPMVLQKQS